jgi:hypothetical protein
LIFVQDLGRTHLADDSPDLNSENLLVLLTPMVLVYGVSLFFLLLDQISLPFPELRFIIIGLFAALACLPLILVFLPPKPNPVAYPPYNPAVIQLVAGWLKDSELAMSDVPAAMAWYGQRQCVLLTLKATADVSDPYTHEDLLSISDYQKPIVTLYITPRTTDSRFYSDWVAAGEISWGSFIIQSLESGEVPPNFPLRKMQKVWMRTGQLVLTDWERWRKTP